MFIGKSVVAFMNLTGWSKLVGRVHEGIGKTVSVLRRAEGPGGVVFVAQEYQLGYNSSSS